MNIFIRLKAIMGRKNRKYTKKQFIDILCSKCNLCVKQNITKHTASFCYEIHRKKGNKFIDEIFPTLSKLHTWKYTNKALELKAFTKLFCVNCSNYNKDIKETQCSFLRSCYINFKQQLDPIITDKHNLTLNNFSKKKLKKFYNKKENTHKAYKAYPTTFYNKDNGWEEFIHEVLNENST